MHGCVARACVIQDEEHDYRTTDGAMAALPMQLALRHQGLDLLRARVGSVDHAIALVLSAAEQKQGLFLYLYKSGKHTAHWAR